MQSLGKLAYISAAYYLLLLLLLPLVACSSHEDDNQSTRAHKAIKTNFHKLSPQMTSNIRVHGLLLWVSMGLLMPAGILSIRISVREPQGSIPAKMLAVLLATAGAVMSIKNFENSFNNNHQRIGLALYIAIWVQALMGFEASQDKREYIQQQGVTLGNNLETITPHQQNDIINNAQTNHNQKDLLPLPCAKRNALMNLFD
ncbi:hypothetical protein FNV43_RR07275 [Rhamnella rubrinervis]|uniref:Cytochrome b561 domain-containing protein n=1 Tax=Rhamnella rubrinervis TaxID=2594499 RepID=A0A8K0HGA6_9ROSA|nr:hypothetical protein FNV43_RR07275 [Rhamnella rubrinervis]